MNRRGAGIQIVLLVLAVVAAATLVLSGHTQAALRARTDVEVRAQALWLARSALSTGMLQVRTVQTPVGFATVEPVRGGTGVGVRVTLEGARAEVTAEPYRERFEPAP